MTALKFSTKWYVIWPKKSAEICDDLKLTSVRECSVYAKTSTVLVTFLLIQFLVNW
jgi:hypothetical protein